MPLARARATCIAVLVAVALATIEGTSAQPRRSFLNPSLLASPDAQAPHWPSGPLLEIPSIDLDAYMADQHSLVVPATADELWTWQLLPQGLIYRSYLAGTKEPRLAAHVVSLRHEGGVFAGVLGTRVGLLRYGSRDPWYPEGFQVDAEGAAHVRMDLPDKVEVQAVDFRAGLPLTYAVGRHRTKLAYYHLSSHVGDEFLLKNPGFTRLNFSRDVLVLGHSVYVWSNWLRLYAEAGYAFYGDISKPWEFQFGADLAPPGPTGFRGAPFVAVNGHLREDVNFGGAVTFEAGWAWRGRHKPDLLRVGLLYYNGESNQFSFFDEHEEQIGLGVWYDM